MSDLVGSDGTVVGVERHATLAHKAQEALNGFFQNKPGADGHEDVNASIRVAVPGVLGWPEDAPYQRILVSAMAKEVPEELFAQLAEGGAMVIPVSRVMLKVVKKNGRAIITRHGLFSFVPLVQD